VNAPRCIATERRLRWALLRAGFGKPRHFDLADVSMNDARKIAWQANVSLAALYLPDPTRWEMVKAWLYGKVHS
jgi:hypothetical protein